MQHPLFPEHEPDDRAVGFLRVWRHEKDGSRFCVPATMGPDELTGIDQIFEAWGGGRYEVVAHEPNGRVLARQRYAFEGASKPLAGGAADEQPATARPAPVPAPGDSGQWGAMLGMMQMFLQMQAQSQQAQTQLVLALMNKGELNSNAHVQSMTQLYSQFGETQGELLKALANRAGGGDSSEAFVKGLEFAREFMEQGPQSEDGIESLLESAGQFFAGMQQAKAAPPAPKSEPPAEAKP
ncbi:MAG: hypothetical protein A2Y61_00575 [Chloroflexi bacterium RBG_13_60_13]|nr:MAG: hypothetical protein A2Y61_00575 [Chloroflexi bacterium RBG_13_60_13]